MAGKVYRTTSLPMGTAIDQALQLPVSELHSPKAQVTYSKVPPSQQERSH